MKNSSFKSIVLTFIALVFCSTIFAQTFTESALDAAAATRLMVNTEATALKTHFTKQGFQEAGFAADATIRFAGSDKIGAFSIEIATLKLRKAASIVKLTTISLKRGNTVETIVAAEDATNIFKFQNQQVRSKSRSAANTVSDCVAQYFGSAAANCASCIACVTSCVSSNGEWVAKAICSIKCVGSCVSCISNLVGFVKCVITVLKD